jgi:hypothetical protein
MAIPVDQRSPYDPRSGRSRPKNTQPQPSPRAHRPQDRGSGDDKGDDDARLVGRSAYTKKEFCQRNAMSLAFFYKLRKAGKGPREMLGRITVDAERDWQKEREAEIHAGAVNKVCVP